MAINSITFGGVNSADFGIYISGEGVFNAPERDVEMIEIPGRNGELALDKGRFKNIEVTYPAFNFEPNDYDTFVQNLSDFRNAICSQIGYHRLSDTFHPDEYRMATYIEGLEVKPIEYNTASKFDIVFNCKPQRYLTSGEEPITIGEWRDTDTISGDIVEVDNPDGVLGVKSLSVALEPIQSGSGTPSPDNVRPISGRTECVTERCGNAVIMNADDYVELPYPVAPSQSFGYKMIDTASTENSRAFNMYDENKGFIDWWTPNGSGTEITKTNSSTKTIKYIRFRNAYSGLRTMAFRNISEGEQYSLDTHTTTLGRTVYGGTLDVVSGELTVNMVMETFDGNSVTWNASKYARLALSNNAIPSEYLLNKCNEYQISNGGASGTLQLATATVARAWDDRFTDADTMKAILNENPIQYCYKLATPQTYQLTPTEVELLMGNNNVWSDGSITLEYGQLPNIVNNPTLFEASPLLEVTGNGDIEIGGEQISITGRPLGEILLSSESSTQTVTLNVSNLKEGDSIYPKLSTTIGSADSTCAEIRFYAASTTMSFHLYETSGDVTVAFKNTHGTSVRAYMMFTNLSFVYGTASTVSGQARLDERRLGTSYRFTLTAEYDGNDTITLTCTYTGGQSGITTNIHSYHLAPFYGNSTKVVLPEPMYIDLDIGEAYGESSGQIVSLNDSVELPSDLPKLSSGANTITYSGDITDLKIIPRWWKV